MAGHRWIPVGFLALESILIAIAIARVCHKLRMKSSKVKLNEYYMALHCAVLVLGIVGAFFGLDYSGSNKTQVFQYVYQTCITVQNFVMAGIMLQVTREQKIIVASPKESYKNAAALVKSFGRVEEYKQDSAWKDAETFTGHGLKLHENWDSMFYILDRVTQ